MGTTYFTTKDTSKLTLDEVVALAVRQVGSIEDLGGRIEDTRRANDNENRHAELNLAELLALHPECDAAIKAVASQTSYTVGALNERVKVYRLSIGEMDTLLEMPLSYSIHRTIVGVRTKSRPGYEQRSLADRIEAAKHSIERNGGTFKGDDQFYEEANLLPPPNSFDRILDNLENDPDYRKKKMGRKSRRRMNNVVMKSASEDGETANPLPHRRDVVDMVLAVTQSYNTLIDYLIDSEKEIPVIVVNEIDNWVTKHSIIRDLTWARATGEQPAATK